MRERTLWTWKLRLYPLVLIPMVWFNFVAPSGELAEDASRGKLLGYQDEAQPQTSGVGATPIQGVTGDGKAYVLHRHETGPIREFSLVLLLPHQFFTNERR